MINVGYISKPIGLKGEVKVVSSLNHLDVIFSKNRVIVLGGSEYVLDYSRFQGDNLIIHINGLDTIEDINKLLKLDIYVDRNDIVLDNTDYLFSDLVNSEVYYQNKKIGCVDEILVNKQYAIIKVNQLLIPLCEHFLENINLNDRIITIKNMEELSE